MSRTTTITISEEIYFSTEFQELLKTKKLSRFIDTLLKSSFNIKKNAAEENEEKLLFELSKINSERATLQEQLDVIVEARKKEESKWRRIY